MKSKSKISSLCDDLYKILKSEQIITDQYELAPFLLEKRNNYKSTSNIVVTPYSSSEVSQVVMLSSSHKVSIVPQGGNTGLVGGSVSSSDQIILSLVKMKQIYKSDMQNNTITLEAGVTIEACQQVCEKYNMLFPLDLASRNQATIGGALSTNAGGLNTVKYGTIKNFTLGLEVVLPSGKIISDLNTLTKRNLGLNFHNIFIGSEGTLGIITAASFKLSVLWHKQLHIIFSSYSISDLVSLYNLLLELYPSRISAFEVMNNTSVLISLKYCIESHFPLDTGQNWYCLVSLDFYKNEELSIQKIENQLRSPRVAKYHNSFFITESTNIWRFRHNMSYAQTKEAEVNKQLSLKNDLAIPLSRMQIFIETAEAKLRAVSLDTTVIIFGHMGDQSLHFNLLLPNHTSYTMKKNFKSTLLDIVLKNEGSISAEHGVGLLNVEYLEHYYKNNQIYMISLLKSLFDPLNIFNPGKVLKV